MPWSGDFPPPGAGDGKVRMPKAEGSWCGIRVAVTLIAIITGVVLFLINR